MATKEAQSSTDFPSITTAPNTTYRAVLSVAGATQATALPYMAPITNEEERSIYELPAGNTVLTLAIARYDVIVASNPVATTLEVPQNATLGYTYVAGKELSFFVQNRGLGGLSVNFTGTAVLQVDNDLDPSTLGPYHTEVCVSSPSADYWVFT